MVRKLRGFAAPSATGTRRVMAYPDNPATPGSAPSARPITIRAADLFPANSPSPGIRDSPAMSSQISPHNNSPTTAPTPKIHSGVSA